MAKQHKAMTRAQKRAYALLIDFPQTAKEIGAEVSDLENLVSRGLAMKVEIGDDDMYSIPSPEEE